VHLHRGRTWKGFHANLGRKIIKLPLRLCMLQRGKRVLTRFTMQIFRYDMLCLERFVSVNAAAGKPKQFFFQGR
jgi:hypothetical protein